MHELMHEPSLLRLGLACHVYVKVIQPYMHEPSLLRLAAGMTCVCVRVRVGLGSHARTELVRACG